MYLLIKYFTFNIKNKTLIPYIKKQSLIQRIIKLIL